MKAGDSLITINVNMKPFDNALSSALRCQIPPLEFPHLVALSSREIAKIDEMRLQYSQKLSRKNRGPTK